MKALSAVCVALTAMLGVSQSKADPGYYASAEYLLLAPKVNSTGFETLFYDGFDHHNIEVDGSFEDDLKSGFRVVLGKEACDGFGVQFRYFHFDQNVEYDGLWDNGIATTPVNGDTGIKVEAFDAELTQRGSFRSWDILVTGGLRYGKVEFDIPSNLFTGIGAVIFGGPTGSDFDGVGPTVSLSAQRPLGYGLSVIGRARTALLFGDVDYVGAFLPNTYLTIEDEFVQVTELQFGLGYDRCLNCGANLNMGVFWEAQRWDSDSNYIGDLALHGLALMAGVNF